MNPQLIEARDLIKAKRYDEARRLLKKLDHPTATSWLQTLDTIAPENAKTSAKAAPTAKPISTTSTSVFAKSKVAPTPTAQAAPAATSKFPEGKDKVQMLKAGELIKAGKITDARRILEKIDHPKAREWLQQIEKRTIPAANSVNNTADAATTSIDGINLRKPLPGVEFGDVKRKAKPSQNTTLIVLVVSVLVFFIGFAALSVASSTSVGMFQLVAFGIPMVLIGLGAFGFTWVFRDFFGAWMLSGLGLRLIVLVVVVIFAGVSVVINSFRRIPFEDAAISLEYSGNWQTDSIANDEICQTNPAERRCVLILWTGVYGGVVYLDIEEDTYNYETTIEWEESGFWEWELENRSPELFHTENITIDGKPAVLREFSLTEEEKTWYRVQILVMRDSRHLLLIYMDARSHDALKGAMGDFQNIYNSIDFPD